MTDSTDITTVNNSQIGRRCDVNINIIKIISMNMCREQIRC